MKKELKRQIKEDEFVSGFSHLLAYLASHRKPVEIGVAAAALLLAAWFGFSSWQTRTTQQAEAAFGAALEIYAAPVRSELPEGAQPAASAPIYETAVEKWKKAAAAFDGVERRFGSHPVARRARYFAALCRIEGGEVAEGQKQLEALAAQGGEALEPALARLAVAEALRRAGAVDKAAEAFLKLASDPLWPLPKDHALMQLGLMLEEAKRPEAARKAFRRVVDEYPASGYAAEARRHADDLEIGAAS